MLFAFSYYIHQKLPWENLFILLLYVSCCQVEWCQYSFLHIVWHEMLMNYLMSFDVGQYTTDEFWRETTRDFGRLLIVVWRLTLTIINYNSDPSYYFKFINCMKEVIHNKVKVVLRNSDRKNTLRNNYLRTKL